ncbi:DUF551 domain-containing protein [Escherichia coli]|uniref:DUF551 domain-containing protein n=1 Tax=Escherichia coli TaxID=562 RepID=UPI001F053923|nr:DUF551 domain-containing protein [Escherichia coli]MCH0685641.1 DUF551 domain-containing protein [Escherichia coli]MDZ8664456.1 DUF551 domain-containing protein [Escherichia coli]WRX87724.1 DUF551 domain-containing protein [Escherichia coli]
MTAQLSREELITSEIADFFAGFVEVHTELGGPNTVEEAQIQLTERVLAVLAAMSSEPVYQVNDGAGSHTWSDCSKDIFDLYSDHRKRIVYAAPPAPVAVDEIAEQAGVNPAIADAYMQGYHDAESRKIAPVAVHDKWPEKLTWSHHDDMTQAEVLAWNNAIDACRAAMQAEPVSAAYKLPDGWIKCSERMPENMSTVIVSNGTDIGHMWWDGDNWTSWHRCDSVPEDVTHWMPLPAAPEQEV